MRRKDDALTKVEKDTGRLALRQEDFIGLFESRLLSVREEMRGNTYIEEALRVLPVGGYRSAIGSIWNAVVDDLRNKVMARSLALFNKSVKLGRDIKSYEDFQNYVTDEVLIDGAHKIGVLSWEASKVLKQAKDTRHIFDGHPSSSEPSVIKVLAMLDDCAKYVLQVEYPAEIIDIDDYVGMLGDEKFDRNQIGVESALGELPEIYKSELANRMFSAYVHPGSSSILRSNIEFVLPLLWEILGKDVKIQIIRRTDQEITKANVDAIDQAFSFVLLTGSLAYLTQTARKYKIEPLVKTLEDNLDNWDEENKAVKDLAPFAAIVPVDLLPRYVSALVHTYVGKVGYSSSYARTDFYADRAATRITKMFEAFDDRAAEAFIDTVKMSTVLRERIRNAQKLRRVRALGQIVRERVSDGFEGGEFLGALVDEEREAELISMLESGRSASKPRRV